MTHPAQEYVDLENPNLLMGFDVKIDGISNRITLSIWNPLEMNSVWTTPISISGAGLPEFASFPGKNPIDSLVMAISFVKNALDGKIDFT